MSESLLELKNIYKSFGGVKALQDINLKIQPGEVLCLAGENGCGKSTIIKIISGFYTPDSGEIVLNGKSYNRMNLREAIRNGVQVVYQDFSIFPNLTVYENIAMNKMVFERRKTVNKKEMKETASDESLAGASSQEVLFEVKSLGLEGCFKDVSFKVHEGEVLGITGLLGSGRTELAKAMYGLMSATEGEIYIKGKKTELKSAIDGVANKIAYVPEDRLTESLFMSQSIERNIVLESLPKVSSKGMYISSKAEEAAKKWVTELRIKTDDPEKNVSTLSGGNQQKVVLAKNLMIDPQVLILNCPTVGVDIGSKMDISALIQEIAGSGVAVILISDDSSEILTNCERFLIIKNGRIVDECKSSEYTDSTLYTKLVE